LLGFLIKEEMNMGIVRRLIVDASMLFIKISNHFFDVFRFFEGDNRKKCIVVFELFHGDTPDGYISYERTKPTDAAFNIKDLFIEQTVNGGLGSVHGDIFKFTVNEKREDLQLRLRKVFNVGFNPSLEEPLFIKVFSDRLEARGQFYGEEDSHIGGSNNGYKAKIILVVISDS